MRLEEYVVPDGFGCAASRVTETTPMPTRRERTRGAGDRPFVSVARINWTTTPSSAPDGPPQNEPGTGQALLASVVTSNWIEKVCGSVVPGTEYVMLHAL